jgi:hypothetical protein
MPQIGDPSLRRLGLSPEEGATPRVRRVTPDAGPGRSILTDLFPTFATVTCGFEQIAIGAAVSITAGLSGWYPLADLVVGQDIEQDCYLDWASAQLTPTESSANGTTNAIWGTTAGTGAAIVVGQDLPTVRNQWTSAPCYVPGVEATTNGNVIANGRSPYDAWWTFPTGDYSDTAPNKTYLPYPLGKVAKRYPRGTRIGVALVVRGSQVTTGANKNLRGRVGVLLRLALTQTTVGFNA